DKARVDHYVELIQNGARPKAIVLHSEFMDTGIYPDGSKWASSVDSALYILDGHHKFLAYSQLGINPEFVLIEKHLTGEEEFAKHRDNLYFQMEWFLDDHSKKHIISHTTKILFGANQKKIVYNR